MFRRAIAALCVVLALIAAAVALWPSGGDRPREVRRDVERPTASAPRRERPKVQQAPAATGLIAGRVVRRGAPVAGATVTVREDGLYQQRTTDEEGAFRFEALPAGYFMVSAVADGEASAVLGPFVLGAGQRREDLLLELRGGATVSGVVRDVRTAREIPNVVVRSSSGTTVTDHAGRFRLGALPAGGTYIEATAQGYEPRQQWLTLEAAREYGGVEIFLRGSTSVRGLVTRLGAPVPGATVWAERADIGPRQDRFDTATTRDDGTFELGVSGGEYVLAAAAPGEGRVTGPRLTVAEGGTYEGLQVELGERLSAHGTVTLDGQPAEGAGLFLIDARSQQVAAAATAGAGGAFRFEGAPVGSYLVQVQAGSATAQRGPFQITGAGDGAWNIDLVSGGALSGRVEPAQAGVVVRYRTTDWAGPFAAESYTDADGRFRFDAVPPGHLNVEAEWGGTWAEARASAGEDVVLRLAQSSIGGVVTDDRGRSVSDFAVKVTPLEGGAARVHPVLSADGTFSVPLPPGRYAVSATSRGYGEATSVEVTVAAGQTVTSLRLTLQAAQEAKGIVVDAQTGQPLAGVQITVMRQRIEHFIQFERWAAMTTDASGRFEFAGIPPRSRMRFRKDGYRVAWLPAEAVSRMADGRLPLRPGQTGRDGFDPYEGVGMNLRQQDGRVFIDSVFDGAPAQQGGILRGDELLSVNGVATTGMSIEAVRQRIMGPSGTQVHLSLRRGERVIDVVVRRRSIQL